MNGEKGTALAGQTLDSGLCAICGMMVATLLLSAPALGQDKVVEARHMLSNQASKRGVGSATQFSGRIAIYHVFARDDHSTWNEVEKNEVLARLNRAYAFLNAQSELHGRKVTFIEKVGPDVHHAERLPTGTFVNPSWTEAVLKQSAGVKSDELVERLKQNHKADNVILCLHINKPALSYNLAYYENVSSEFAAERMVCFTTYPDMRPTSAATYAHEVLHLFGAGDLYFPYDQDDYRKQVARRYFPNDIMFRVDYNLDRLNVGSFTAYRVGWRDEIDVAHKMFED